MSAAMHESTLARQILTAVLARAHEENASRVVCVHGWIAETEAIARESLEAHFAACALGTIAQDAELALDLVRVQAKCVRCGVTFAPEHHVVMCPGCGSTEAELLGRTGMGVDRIELETR